jgi:4-amino-4-deoxy-L-arabinose transferase-like glycosyltransferase
MSVQIKTEKTIGFVVHSYGGKAHKEKYRKREWIAGDNYFQTVRVRLPLKHLRSFRINPLNEPGIVYINFIKLSSFFGKDHVWLAKDILRDFRPEHDIGRFELVNDSLLVESIGKDPSFICTVPVPLMSQVKKIWIFLFLIIASIILLFSVRYFLEHRKKILKGPLLWLGLIILLSLLIRSYHITSPIDDLHAFRQTQTAGLVRDFSREGIDLFYPKMNTLGNPGYVVLEFPLYQALAALLYKSLAPDIIWARLLSISFGLLTILFVYRITKKFMGQKSAIFASLFFAFTPLNIFFNRVPIPESLTILLSLMMLDFLGEGINNKKNIFLIIGIFAGCLGLILKSPYVAPLYLPIIYMAYKQEGKLRFLLNIRLLSAFLIPLAIMVLWQRHANSVNEIYFNTNDYPFQQLYPAVVVKLKPFNYWFFGTFGQRIDFNNYLIILERISKEMLSFVGILFLVFGFFGVTKNRRSAFFYIWLFSVLFSIMLVFNLNVVHNYYQLPLAPILSIFCGAGVGFFIELFKNKGFALSVAAPLICLYLFLSCTIALRFYEKENNLLRVGEFIDGSIEKDAMIATCLPGIDLWESALMYYSDRRGFDVGLKRLNEDMVAYLRSKGIKYLVMVDYEETDNLINSFLSSYRIVIENERAKIYDISQKNDISKWLGVHHILRIGKGAMVIPDNCSKHAGCFSIKSIMFFELILKQAKKPLILLDLR